MRINEKNQIGQPLISIIMPAYNCEKYIEDSIKSVLYQTYQNWELIVIDDKSKDNTYALLNKLKVQDNRIKVFQNERNMGVGQTRNRGVELANGQWIAFLDSDDLWKKEKLEKQIQKLKEQQQAKLLFTASAFISEDGTPKDYILHIPEKVNRKQLLKQNIISCSSVLVQKSYLKKYPMSGNVMIHEDFAVWLQILSEETYAYGIDEPLLVYRVSANSKSGNKIKAAKMNWNTYKYVDINRMQAIYYMFCYIVRGLLKYRKLSN